MMHGQENIKSIPIRSVRNTVTILTEISGFLEPGTYRVRINSKREKLWA